MAAARPVLSPDALVDLDEIWLYIAADSVEAADKVADELYEAIYKLAENPYMGHAREDLTTEPLRFWSVYSYLIVYRPDTKPLQVARVLHGARDVKSVLKKSAE